MHPEMPTKKILEIEYPRNEGIPAKRKIADELIDSENGTLFVVFAYFSFSYVLPFLTSHEFLTFFLFSCSTSYSVPKITMKTDA